MSNSAFGVDHGDISKIFGSELVPSAYAAHGAVSGKKGKKLRATGNEGGGSLAGLVAGSTAGALPGLLRRSPILAGVGGEVGGAVGGVGGGMAGHSRNKRKGYLK